MEVRGTGTVAEMADTQSSIDGVAVNAGAVNVRAN
jgi:hypothetical protein